MKCNLCGNQHTVQYFEPTNERPFFECQFCHGRVSAKAGKPLGTLATQKTRKKRKQLHDQIDPLWESGRLSRSKVYQKLSQHIGVPNAHIGFLKPHKLDLALEITKDPNWWQNPKPTYLNRPKPLNRRYKKSCR